MLINTDQNLGIDPKYFDIDRGSPEYTTLSIIYSALNSRCFAWHPYTLRSKSLFGHI